MTEQIKPKKGRIRDRDPCGSVSKTSMLDELESGWEPGEYMEQLKTAALPAHVPHGEQGGSVSNGQKKEMTVMKERKARAAELPVKKIRPFEGHPFQVKDDEQMDRLVYSLLTQGLLTPLVVRPINNNEYEVISCHRRLWACQKAGIETVPALINVLDWDEAAIALVDSNLHRERILPGEKAFAYKLKMEALSHQGTSRQVGEKWSVQQLSESGTDSERQIHRYIRLTNLIPEILTMVDEGKIALTPAVELSYLTEQEQRDLLEAMESEDCTPSLSQAGRLKKLSQDGALDTEKMLEILREPKANQQEKISFRMDEIWEFFPKTYSTAKIQETILKLLSEYQKKRRCAQER